eukprot:2006835-Amphidinium_carterae.1
MSAGTLFRVGKFGGKAIETAEKLDDVDVDTDVASAASGSTPPTVALPQSDAVKQAQRLLALKLIYGNPSEKDLAKAALIA